MTGPTQPRQGPNRRTATSRTGSAGFGPGGRSRSSVGEQLREAREVRGFDLYRAERDTKIRSKYLEALEAGDFADLPGEVYTRGFLRNYASYLGLDPDEIIDEWRRETGEHVAAPTSAASFGGPKPVTIRRGLRLERTHLAIVGVVVIVALIGSYFGLQITRFLQYPTLGMSDPSGTQTLSVPAGTTTYVLQGTATPGTTVLISWDGQDPSPILVGDTGKWTYTAQLHFGSNQFDISAKNLDTNHASKTARVIILVPVVTPTPPMPGIAFEKPTDGASISGGAVTVSGTSTQILSLVLAWTYVSAPPVAGATLPPISPANSPGASAASPALTPGASPGASPGPTPMTVHPNADGTFSIPIQLAPGYYQLALYGIGNNGKNTETVYRAVVVPYKGLNILLQVSGGPASVRYSGDGALIASGVFPSGRTATVVVSKWFCLYTPRPGLVYVTVNGVSLGPVSRYGGSHLYLDTTHAPKNVSACPV